MNLVYGLAPHEFSVAQVDRVFSHEATASILVSQNNETAAMLVSQIIGSNPVGDSDFLFVPSS